MARNSSSSRSSVHARYRTLLGAVAFALAWPPAAGAHRLDEYLQATRVDVLRDRVRVEIDLTPGVAVAPSILASIDADRDGRISMAEADAYGSEVLRHVALVQDDQRQTLTLERIEVPSADEILAGMGTIRLEARALVTSARGQHRLSFRNSHRTDVGVYLVNALAPSTNQLTIKGQRRDAEQRGIELDYAVASGPLGSAEVPLGLLTLMGAALMARRRAAGR